MPASVAAFQIISTKDARRVLGVDHRQLSDLAKIELLNRQLPYQQRERAVRVPTWLVQRLSAEKSHAEDLS